jgi:hypothetical protein
MKGWREHSALYEKASRLLDKSFFLEKEMRKDIKTASELLKSIHEPVEIEPLRKQGELFEEQFFRPVCDERLSKLCLGSLVETI